MIVTRCLKQHCLALEYAKQSLAIAYEINHQQDKGMTLASLANTYWHQKPYVRALWLIVQSLLILPPWARAYFLAFPISFSSPQLPLKREGGIQSKFPFLRGI